MALSLEPMDDTRATTGGAPLAIKPLAVKELKAYYAQFCRDAESLRLPFTSDAGDITRNQPFTADDYERTLFRHVRSIGSAAFPETLEQLRKHGQYLCGTFERFSPQSQQRLIAQSDAVIKDLAESRNGYLVKSHASMVTNKNLLTVTELKKFFTNLGTSCKKQELSHYPDSSIASGPGSDPQVSKPLRSFAAYNYEEALCAEMLALGGASIPTTPDELRNLGTSVCSNFAQSHHLPPKFTEKLCETWAAAVSQLESSLLR